MKAHEVLPDDQNQIVRDGVVVRKGTVGAFLVNAKAWETSPAGSSERESLQADMADALPALRTMGIFDVFSIKDEALKHWVDSQ